LLLNVSAIATFSGGLVARVNLTACSPRYHLSYNARVADYSIVGLDNVLTPALAIYAGLVDANIDFTLELLGSNANRWRPHVKTAKLESIMRRLVARDVTNFKCATTLELRTACDAGARDILVAYPLAGANAARVRQLAETTQNACVSALVESADQLQPWLRSDIGLFIDIDPGMHRTGLPQERVEDIVSLARAIRSAGLRFRGLHYYDGHLHEADLAARTRAAHAGYDRLLQIVKAIDDAGTRVEEVITAGTPTFPCTLSYPGFHNAIFLHRASPGTVVYGDASAVQQLPLDYRYQPAVLVVSRVVSHPGGNIVTCDAGHKTLSVDTGVPNCEVLGRPDLKPLKPSEEHLPIAVPQGNPLPPIGSFLYLVPKHVCPTVNNFDDALIVSNGRIDCVERVTARGREYPMMAMA
jgi:D-serine deaminase-like pyridoxal phosphate-dependent protein